MIDQVKHDISFKDAHELLHHIVVQVYRQELDLTLINEKIIPTSLDVANMYGLLPINFIVCAGNTSRMDVQLSKGLLQSSTNPALYKIPCCTYWAKKCYIRFVSE